MSKQVGSGSVFVSIIEDRRGGHSEDIQETLKKTRYQDKFKIYQKLQKAPDSLLQLTLEEILASELVLIDGICDDEQKYKDGLIQFGIAFALEKPRYLFFIKDNSVRKGRINSIYVDPYIIELPGYDGFAELINEKLEVWITQPHIKPRKPTHIIHEAFSIIGVNESTNDDVPRRIKEFATSRKWHGNFYKPPSGVNIHEELSKQVGTRTFCLFCINASSDVDVYIAIGLAIGLGVPFLVIKEQGLVVPEIVNNHAVITYAGQTDLSRKLAEYTERFFSLDLFRTYEGFSYNNLLSKTETRLSKTTTKDELEEIEKTILPMTKVGRTPVIQAYVLLGDLCRRKNQYLEPLNTSYLQQAISWYEKALKIQPDYSRCIDGIESTNRLIQLIDLLVHKKYDSITELIYLIGYKIKKEHYQYLKSFLLGEVNKLLEKKDYLRAIALIAAIQKHDESQEFKDLWEKVDPGIFLQAIQLYQQDELELKNKLSVALANNKKVFDQLSNAYKELNEINQIATKLDNPSSFYGDTVFVNLERFGWATYSPIKGLPYVIRNGEKKLATEGMAILSGDTVYDSEGVQQFHRLSDHENSILEYYKNMSPND